MMLTLKEQLVCLSLQGATYRQIWYYLKKAFESGALHHSRSIGECQQELQSLESSDPTFRGRALHFHLDTGQEEFIRKLAQNTFMVGEAIYPSRWLEIPKPPLLIYYEGQLQWLSEPLVSLVGTRSITPQGQKDAQCLTQALCRMGYVCVSGMALGVDACVHQTALNTPGGRTIAVLPAGFQQCYPKCHQPLLNQLSQNQLVLSEYPPHVGIKKHHFIMRNRLVAGLSPALVVVEAAMRSGSLITANYALQYNRELYVCPGHVSDTMSAGCNQLLESGARAIYCLSDFIEELNSLYQLQESK